MKNFIVLCKEKDVKNIVMYRELSYNEAQSMMKRLKKDGASMIQLRRITKGASSVLVG